MWLLGLVASAYAASGLAEPTTGAWVEGHAGLGVTDAVGLGTDASVGFWAGRYDPDYALGRYVGVGAGVRTGPGLVAPTLEVRRGVDLLIVGLHGFLAGGYDLTDDAPLVELGVGVKVRVRPTGRYLGWQARLHLGGTYAGAVEPYVALTLGGALQGPL